MKPGATYRRIIAASWLAAAWMTLCFPSSASARLTVDEPRPLDRAHPHLFETNGAALDAEDFPVRVVTVGSPPSDVSVSAWSALAEASTAAWSAVPCAFARVEYAGHRDSAQDIGDGEVPIVVDTACVPEDLAAVTTFTPCAGYPARTIFINDMQFEWTIEPQPFQERGEDGRPRIIDLESAMTHELGHVLGLSHPDDRLATMYASYRPDGSMRTLALDDKLGMCSLYPADNPVPECSEQRPCPDPETCVDTDGFTLCREFRGTTGDQCGLDQLVCEQRCALEDGETGFCTAACQAPGDCPEGFDCVDGLLGADEGAYCAPIDTEEPPRGCCNTAVRHRPPTPLLLAGLLGLCVVGVRRRAARGD